MWVEMSDLKKGNSYYVTEDNCLRKITKMAMEMLNLLTFFFFTSVVSTLR